MRALDRLPRGRTRGAMPRMVALFGAAIIAVVVATSASPVVRADPPPSHFGAMAGGLAGARQPEGFVQGVVLVRRQRCLPVRDGHLLLGRQGGRQAARSIRRPAPRRAPSATPRQRRRACTTCRPSPASSIPPGGPMRAGGPHLVWGRPRGVARAQAPQRACERGPPRDVPGEPGRLHLPDRAIHLGRIAARRPRRARWLVRRGPEPGEGPEVERRRQPRPDGHGVRRGMRAAHARTGDLPRQARPHPDPDTDANADPHADPEAHTHAHADPDSVADGPPITVGPADGGTIAGGPRSHQPARGRRRHRPGAWSSRRARRPAARTPTCRRSCRTSAVPTAARSTRRSSRPTCC